MKLLLDSHFVLWFASDQARLTNAERALFTRLDTTVIVSSIALWELRLKWDSIDKKGKRKLDVDPVSLAGVYEALGTEMAVFDAQQAVAPLHAAIGHRDPFDVMLLVQAQQLDAKLLTRDVKDFEEMVAKSKRMALRHGIAKAGDRLVLMAGVPFGTPGSTNVLHVVRLTGDELKAR